MEHILQRRRMPNQVSEVISEAEMDHAKGVNEVGDSEVDPKGGKEVAPVRAIPNVVTPDPIEERTKVGGYRSNKTHH